MLLTQKTNLDVNTNEEQKEILPIAKESFPYLCSTTRLDCTPDKSVPWHWHNMFEISYIIKGELSLQTPDETHIISTGEIYFINNGVLHTCTAIGTIPCEYNTIQFDMHFLSGMYNSIYEEKYILPVMRNSALQLWQVKPDSLQHLKMIETVLRTVEISREEPFAFEFDLRNLLSDFWKMLLLDTEEIRAQASDVIRTSSTDTERLKLMTRYIKEHCGEKLTLEDIAAAADISTRECTRCFARCINTSPIVYLTQTRLSMAADLLSGSAKSIIEISEECGFSSPSYFGKVFREAMGCTPKEYRDKDVGGNQPWYYSTQFSKISRRQHPPFQQSAH
jgi:AraC-like DNA-binding protein/quercetin dioxygenase-like cupin family protein